MFSTKRGLRVIIMIQTVLIILLIIATIDFRAKGVGAQAGVDYYRKALIALHEDHEAVLRRNILREREDLKLEYLQTLEVAVRYGVVDEKEAATRIRLIGD